MQELVVRLKEFALDQGPEILVAIAILIVGWLVALLGSLLVRKAFKRTEIDNKIANWLVGEERAKSIEIEKWIGRCVFFLIMLFVLVAFFEALGLTVITEPLSRFLIQIFDYAPRLIGPAVLLLVAWVAATGLRFLVRKLLSATKLDEKLSSQVGLEEGESVPLSRTLGDAVYWLIFLLFLPAVLGALNLSGLLQPVQSMLDKILGFLPNLFAAGLILGVGWLLARIVQRIASNLLAAIGADRLSEQVGLDTALGDQKLSGLVGLVLYVLILVPVLVASLNALSLDAITRPASEMLSTFLAALPLVFAAALVILIAYLVGRVVAGLVTNLLAGVGFNMVLVRLGVGSEPEEGQQTPSQIAGNLVMVAIMLFATIEAVDILGFAVLCRAGGPVPGLCRPCRCSVWSSSPWGCSWPTWRPRPSTASTASQAPAAGSGGTGLDPGPGRRHGLAPDGPGQRDHHPRLRPAARRHRGGRGHRLRHRRPRPRRRDAQRLAAADGEEVATDDLTSKETRNENHQGRHETRRHFGRSAV